MKRTIAILVAALALAGCGLVGGHSAAWQHGYEFGYNMQQDSAETGDPGALTSSEAHEFCSEEPGSGSTAAMPGKYGMQAPPAALSGPGVSDWVAGCVAAMSSVNG